MVTVDTDPTVGPPVLDAVAELAPAIAARAAETEARRSVPPDLIDDLAAAGCFRMLRPPSHGGDGLDLVAAMRVLEELARADGSVGWTVGIAAGSWIDLAGLPRPSFDALFAAGPDVVIGGAIAPAGTADRVDGGYRVSGRWGFVSGCEHAAWLFGNCVDLGAEPPAAGDGPPPMRLAVFPPGAVTIEDTWTVSGLCGTGSHHIVAEDILVPAEWTVPVMTAEPCIDEPVTRIPLPSPYAAMLGGVAVGIAQGALDDLLGLAADKVPLFSPARLASDPLFLHDLASADARLRAARDALHADTARLWASAAAREPVRLEDRARVRASATTATATAADVVDTAYTAGGGTSLYRDSPLQRRLRDIRAVTQHFLVRPGTLTTAGAVLAGQETDTSLL